jgi:hypothetical protein
MRAAEMVFRRAFSAIILIALPGNFVACAEIRFVRPAQNLENKRSEISLPARSMVLKVVTGKILETLELAWFPSRLDRFRCWAGNWNNTEMLFPFSMLPS